MLGVIPVDCPAKSKEVRKELCDLFYPYGCGARCERLYKRWIKDEKEVRELEGAEDV